MGYKLNLWQVDEGYNWQWLNPNGNITFGHTTASTKPVALWCAVQAIF